MLGCQYLERLHLVGHLVLLSLTSQLDLELLQQQCGQKDREEDSLAISSSEIFAGLTVI
jgi:hypothetical protein